jgi:glycosyltransferase involved in cell wall biosynthesis
MYAWHLTLAPGAAQAAERRARTAALAEANGLSVPGAKRARGGGDDDDDGGAAPVDPRNVKVLLPWFDRAARCTGNDFLTGLHQVVSSMPDLKLTVAITPSRFAPSIVQFFKNLREKTNGRVTIVRRTPLNARPILFSAHDLTLAPAECDNYGLIPLTSIYMGTPVLSSNVSPQRDIVESGQNGLLIRTKSDYDEHGVVHALPDYSLLIGALQDFAAEPRHIDTLNKHVSKGLPQRRRAFDAGWRQILNIA